MSLSQIIKIDVKRFFEVTPIIVLLCLLLQIGIWVVLVFQSQQTLERNENKKYREAKEWNDIVRQSQLIKNYQYNQPSWLIFSADDRSSPSKSFIIKGQASLEEWQALLDSIQQEVSVSLASLQWQYMSLEGWFGELEFHVRSPKKTHPYYDWLPVRMTSASSLNTPWRLVSVIRVDKKVSALLQNQNDGYWVKEGDWLPSLGVKVHSVSEERVTILAKNGQKRVINRQSSGGDK
ncbi:hypothetical protein OFY17_14045 [Marinomonas sp. C2222]|uniref:Uncharacterized protein n=1 Tax=Marinomonas sargassi TaxID=2984494 RepID=A0ABT2YVR7_9GAMM|nr:hypothetical protein [Marinomonas sargassi]MCV2403987.1 hypothetical protein [Marinomonas sargassi]